MASELVSLGVTAGKVVIVTGAACGIGQANARTVAAAGRRLAAWDLNLAGATATAQHIFDAGAHAVAVQADATDDSPVQAGLEASTTLSEAGNLVNYAGPASASDRCSEQGLLAGVAGVRGLADTSLAGSLPPQSALVNVSSVTNAPLGTAPDWYAATKDAIAGCTRHLATYRFEQMPANAAVPGMIDTPQLTGFATSEIGQRALQRIPSRAAERARRDLVGDHVPAEPARVLRERRLAHRRRRLGRDAATDLVEAA